LELDDIRKVKFSACKKDSIDGPVFLRGRFHVDEPAGTFLRCDKLAKGQAWINGFNLGRYWTSAGPQKTLYIPAALLKQGENELVIFETDAASEMRVELTDKSDLG
jgi:beta-galactosidase